MHAPWRRADGIPQEVSGARCHVFVRVKTEVLRDFLRHWKEKKKEKKMMMLQVRYGVKEKGTPSPPPSHHPWDDMTWWRVQTTTDGCPRKSMEGDTGICSVDGCSCPKKELSTH